MRDITHRGTSLRLQGVEIAAPGFRHRRRVGEVILVELFDEWRIRAEQVRSRSELFHHVDCHLCVLLSLQSANCSGGPEKNGMATSRHPVEVVVGLVRRLSLFVSYGRCSSTGTSRRAAPTYNWRGRPILYSGSVIISSHWVIQPTVRASAKMQVNIDVGMPSAFCTMPE